MTGLWHKIRTSGFLRDVRLVAIGTLVAQVAMIAVAPLLTRLFTPEDFGVFAVVVAVGSILTTFASLRLDVMIPLSKSRSTAIFFTQFVILIALICASLIAVGLLVADTALTSRIGIIDPAAGYTVLLLPAMVLVLGLMAVVRGLAVRHAAFRNIGRAQIARILVLIAVSLGLGYSGLIEATGAGLLLGQLAGDMVFSIWLLLVLPSSLTLSLLRPNLRRIWGAVKAHKSAIKMLGTTQVMAVIYERAPVFAIAAAYGPVTAGFYALAGRVAGGPASLVASAFDDVFRQRASKSWNASKRFDVLIRRGMMLTLAVSVLPGLALIIAMPHIVVPVFGPQWADATYTMVLMFAVAVFGFNSKAFDKTALILGANRFLYLWHLSRMVIELGAAIMALTGLWPYEVYLAVVATGRAALYTLKLVAGYLMSRTAPLKQVTKA